MRKKEETMARAQKCAGGCGRTQDVTVDPKGGTKGSFSLQPPWMCPDCKAKEEKRRAAEQVKKDAAKAGPEKAADKGFTLVPGRRNSMVPPDLQTKPEAEPPAPPALPAPEPDAGDNVPDKHEATTEPPEAAAEA